MGAPLRRLAGGKRVESSALHGLADARRPAHAFRRGLDGEHLLLGLLGFFGRRLLGRFFRGGLLRGGLLAARRALRRRRRLLHLLVGGLLLLLGRRHLGRRLLRGTRAGEYASRRRRNKTRASTGSGVAGRFAFGVALLVFLGLGLGFSSSISSSNGAGVGRSRAWAWKASTASCVNDDGKGTEGGFARPPKPLAVSIHCFLGSVASVQVCGHLT